MKKLQGVVTAMTTPFFPDGEVDYEAIKQHVEWQISKGVDCLYPCGTTGEMYLMTEDQRKKVAETVVKQAAGRVTVYIHCGAVSEDEVIRLSRHAYEIGADGVGIVTPSYFHLSPRMMVEYYKRICDALPDGFPVYVYVIPQCSGNDITGETMQQIANACRNNVIGVKYSFANMRRFIEYLKVNNGNFSVVFGPDDLFLPALILGADGTVSGCASCIPEPFVEIYRLYNEGKLEEARKAQLFCYDMVQDLRNGSDGSIYKNIQQYRGLPGGVMHKPLMDLLPDEVEEMFTRMRPYLDYVGA